jgi:glycosyltransferase involved in cell wall biosynthesis
VTSRRIAIVVQRYGRKVVGGSETLAREYAERLARRHEVTVYTTTALDYVTWRSELPEGRGEEAGVSVRRFAAESERDLRSFNHFAESLYRKIPARNEEEEFLRRQGPWVPTLVEGLRADDAANPFAAILLMTYLYLPTVFSARIAPQRTILVPTAHDEPPLRFSVFRELFESVRGFAFCSEPEAALVAERFAVARRSGDVVGIGVDPPRTGERNERSTAQGAVSQTGPDPDPDPDYDEFRITFSIERPYLLYAGRIDAGKGCDELIRLYLSAQANVMGCPDLLLIGHLAMDLPKTPRIRHLGFVSDVEKRSAMAGADALVCPSRYESLSITLLEAMSLGTPVLATGGSAVLKDHCQQSNGGLWYEDAETFQEGLRVLAFDRDFRARLGANGRDYVARRFSWSDVMTRLEAAITLAG